MSQPILRIWANRDYAWFMGGGVPSYLTSWMQRVGVGWATWELTNSTAWLGIVAAADLAPMIFMAAFAGAITDRNNALTQMRISQFLLFLQAIALAGLQFSGLMTIEWLVLLSLWSGLVYPFHQTARHSVVASIVPREDFAPAIGADSAFFQASRFVGPSIAGLVIPVFGVGGTFIAHSIGAGWFSLALHVVRMERSNRHAKARGGLLSDVKESFVFVRRHRGIFPLFFMLTTACVFLRPQQDMFPAFAGDVFHSDAVGLSWLNSATGVGALVSATAIAARGRIHGLTMVVFTGFLVFCAATLGFIATDNLWVAVIFAALGGFSLNTMTTSIQTLTQSALPDAMRGRVMGLYSLIWRGTPAAGALAAGFLADYIGIRTTFGIGAVLCLGALALTFPRRRVVEAAMEHPHD